jgi:triosephosphate isomerase
MIEGVAEMLREGKKYLIGNWKMFKDEIQAHAHFHLLAQFLAEKKIFLDVAIAAPSVFLSDLVRKTQNLVTLLAQNVHWEREGPFTGEISVPMLRSLGVSGSLVGHSERRLSFGENNVTAGKRMGALLRGGLKAVLCVGESLEERDQGRWSRVLETQVCQAFEASGVKNAFEILGSFAQSPLLFVAYEPVWAIGSGHAASPAQAQEAHSFLRNIFSFYFGRDVGEYVKILYGGSVKASNIKDFLSCPDIDGALVGGASLNVQEFFQMCERAASLVKG